MNGILILLAVIGAGYALSWWLGQRRKQEHRFISLVLFRSRPSALNASALTEAAERAWAVQFSGEESATDWVVGEPPLLMAKAKGFHFVVNVNDRPYHALKSSSSPEPPHGMPAHAAWISVDLLMTDEPQTDGAVYARAGKLIEALIDEDCVALFVPAKGYVFALDTPDHVATVRGALSNEDVISVLSSNIPSGEVAAQPIGV